MNCSPLAPSSGTIIPPVIRESLSHLLRGPARGHRLHRRQVCVLALGYMGDFVLLLSALHVLAAEFGAGECAFVVPEACAALAARELPGVKLITLVPSAPGLIRHMVPAWWRERGKFAPYHFAHRISLTHQRGLYYELVLSWIDAGRDIRLLPATYPATPANGMSTELLAHRKTLEVVLGRPVSRGEILPAFNSFASQPQRRLVVYPLSRDPAKNLSAERVSSILRCWSGHPQVPVTFGGQPEDRATLERYATAARAAGVPAVTVETPAGICAFVEHLAGAGAILSAESAAAHMGTALDQPTVVVVPQRIWGYCQPWYKSKRQHAFVFETPDTEIAAALPAL